MPLNPEALTWTGLLSQWIQFAQATVALKKEDDGERWRASVPAIINLQAVTFALADLDRLPPQEHALALDKAEILIVSSAAHLAEIWKHAVMSTSLQEIVTDAQALLHQRRQASGDKP